MCYILSILYVHYTLCTTHTVVYVHYFVNYSVLYMCIICSIIITTTKQKAAGTATNLPTAPNKKTLKGCPNYNTGKGTKQ